MTPVNTSRCAFTMTELLVVVAVIGLLAGLSAAAITRGLHSARTARCLSNHRQLALAWMMYIGDYSDALPLNLDGLHGEPYTNWVVGNMKVAQSREASPLADGVNTALFSKYLREASILKCAGQRERLSRTISMNNRMNPSREDGPVRWIGGYGTNYATFRKLGSIQNPSDIFIFIDESPSSVNDGSFAVDMSNTGDGWGSGTRRPYYIVDRPGSAHQGGSSVAFADGRAERHAWSETTTVATATSSAGATYTSMEDKDAMWIQSKTTYAK